MLLKIGLLACILACAATVRADNISILFHDTGYDLTMTITGSTDPGICVESETDKTCSFNLPSYGNLYSLTYAHISFFWVPFLEPETDFYTGEYTLGANGMIDSTSVDSGIPDGGLWTGFNVSYSLFASRPFPGDGGFGHRLKGPDISWVDNLQWSDGSMTHIEVLAEAPVPTPEPGTYLLLGTGLVGIWKRFRKATVK